MRCAYSSITCPAGDDVPGHVGGDVVAVVETPAAVRVLVGDVMGHGQRARETAAEVRRAFRRLAAREEDPPQVIAARLDQFVARRDQRKHDLNTNDAEERLRRREEFVTAQFIDVPRGCADAEPRIVSCGHPPPLVLSGGRATFLDAIPAVPPLGLLGLAAETCPRSRPLGARAGDVVLLYTDGVTEARDSLGVPYPFAGRAAAVARHLAAALGGSLDESVASALIEALKGDLLAHAGGVVDDDATLMYLWLADEPCGSVPADPTDLGEDGNVVGLSLSGSRWPRRRLRVRADGASPGGSRCQRAPYAPPPAVSWPRQRTRGAWSRTSSGRRRGPGASRSAPAG